MHVDFSTCTLCNVNACSSSESVYTVRRARNILENLADGEQPFDFSEINQTAIQAQNVAQETLNSVSSFPCSNSTKKYTFHCFTQLSTVNVTSLVQQAASEVASSQRLSDGSLSLLTSAQGNIKI